MQQSNTTTPVRKDKPCNQFFIFFIFVSLCGAKVMIFFYMSQATFGLFRPKSHISSFRAAFATPDCHSLVACDKRAAYYTIKLHESCLTSMREEGRISMEFVVPKFGSDFLRERNTFEFVGIIPYMHIQLCLKMIY
jgi:hypothetical protein